MLLMVVGPLLGLAALTMSGTEVRLEVRLVERPPLGPANTLYPGNPPPLAPRPLVELGVGAVTPRGWLRTQLERQADGFTGHLTEISRFLKKENNAWLDPEGAGENPWEEVPYWLKGFAPTGYLLGEKRIIDEARIWIDAVIASQREDGYFGPRANLTRIASDSGGKPDLWPNMIMLDALQAYHEWSGDARVLDLMCRYFRWELQLAEDDFLLPFWQQQRGADNLASVYWLYRRRPEPWLLDLARKIHRRTAPWSRGVANGHGVNIAQAFRGPAIYYQQSRNLWHLAATDGDYRTVMQEYGQVPGGMFGADENCRPGFTGPRQAAETCTMVEFMLSFEMLCGITGEAKWADRCEEVAFNSLPAAMTEDLRALRYLTAPNMVLSDAASKSPGLQNGGPMLLFDPHRHRCCQHNVGHGWPNFTAHLWMATAGDGLAAVIHAPCHLSASVGGGVKVAIEEKTDYPFDETVRLAIDPERPVSFPLYLRVPGWCQNPTLAVNGRDFSPAIVGGNPAGRFVVVTRVWERGDEVRVRLPMKVALRRHPANQDSVSVRRGPLTYALRIAAEKVRAGGTDAWPAWELHPATPWNYGLVLDESSPADSFEVIRRPGPLRDQPFAVDAAPVLLRARGRRIPAWQLDHLGLVGRLQPSPVRSQEPVETILLVPMGCERLRIAAFPVIGEGRSAHDWVAPPRPRPALPARASHCWQGDTLDALTDGLEPSRSDDQTIPRFTWWPRRGTTEWVEVDLGEPRSVSSIGIYWFDDRPRGGCRVPAAWRLYFRDGEEWRELTGTSSPGTARDRLNEFAFPPVRTRSLRLEVDLQEGFSSGILEWRLGRRG